jgi:hypothetical protein
MHRKSDLYLSERKLIGHDEKVFGAVNKDAGISLAHSTKIALYLIGYLFHLFSSNSLIINLLPKTDSIPVRFKNP